MKKIISLLLSALLSLSFCACAVKTGGNSSSGLNSGNGASGESGVSGESGSGDSGSESNQPTEDSYTVRLTYQGAQFNPSSMGAGTYVQWTGITETGDVTGFQTAEFNKDGIAYLNGLDGEYRVTLQNLPEGYAYNPNLYVASGSSRHVEIEIYPIIKTTKSGADLYNNIIKINKEGVYRVNITKAYPKEKGVYYEFTPPTNGLYSVQSIVDVTQDAINPIAEIYTGTFASKHYSHTCDDGVEFENGSYTKNFYFEGDATEEQSGHVVIPFAVRATAKNGEFPITVDFLVTREDDFEDPHSPAELIYAKELPSEKAPEGVGTWTYAETKKNGSWVFDGANYVYNEEDGFYHVGTKDGPYLYVTLSVPDRFLPPYTPPGSSVSYPVAFTTIESIAPTAYLRVAELDRETGERTGRLIHYKPMIEQDYAGVCNSEGRCLVTKELQWFLQELCESNAYFNDGFGWVETYSPSVTDGNYSVSALEDDQWLFACGYYKP